MIHRRLIVCLAAFLLSVPLAGDARSSYRQGINAMERRDWRTAIEHLNAAIAEKPVENAGRFRRYLPYYYLGQALFETGDCPGALTAWQESERQGAVAKGHELAAIRRGRQACARREARAEQQIRKAQDQALNRDVLQGVSVAESVAARFARLHSDPRLRDFWGQGTPSAEERLDAAGRLLDQARQVAADPRRSADAELLERAQTWALTAQRQMEGLLVEADDFLSAASDLTPLIAEANGLLAEAPELEPVPPRLALAVETVRALLADIEVAQDRSEASEGSFPAVELSRQLEEATARLRDAVAPPPRELLAAAEAFIRANYAGVVTLLDGLAFTTDREGAHAHLLLAAARFALHQSGEDGDSGLLELARRDARETASLMSDLKPSEDLFSPRFVDFFVHTIDQTDQ